MDAWLSKKQSTAESDNYGQDLEDVEVKQILSLAKQEDLGHVIAAGITVSLKYILEVDIAP